MEAEQRMKEREPDLPLPPPPSAKPDPLTQAAQHNCCNPLLPPHLTKRLHGGHDARVPPATVPGITARHLRNSLSVHS